MRRDDEQSRIKFYQADPDGWLRILAINNGGAFLMARFAAEHDVQARMGAHHQRDDELRHHDGRGALRLWRLQGGARSRLCIWAKDLDGTGVTVNVLVPGGPTETPGFFPPGVPRPPVLLNPELMGMPVVWLASAASDGITGCRFIARDWDTRLPPAEAAARARAPIGWPDLAQRASSARGHAM